MTSFICLTAVLTEVVFGGILGHLFCHKKKAPVVPRTEVVVHRVVDECDECGCDLARIEEELVRLRCSARWRTRDNAAHALKKFDWRCHPEILPALVDAMLTDCEEEVREEAAESLRDIDPPPCVPEVHAALAFTARRDPDHTTRKVAGKALARIGTSCVESCAICEPPIPTGRIVPGEVIGGAPIYRVSPYPTLDGPGFVVPETNLTPRSRELPPSVAIPGRSIAPTRRDVLPGREVYPPVDGLPPVELESQPRADDGDLPTLDGPILPPAGVPAPTIPPLPGDVNPFGAPPEARRPLDERITSRERGVPPDSMIESTSRRHNNAARSNGQAEPNLEELEDSNVDSRSRLTNGRDRQGRSLLYRALLRRNR